MKGYIYLLKEKGHTKCHKIGRTNNLKRRLEQYNSGKTKITPDYLLEMEGDIERAVPFNELPIEGKNKLIERDGMDAPYIKENWFVQIAHRRPAQYEFEYIHTVRVKDCIEAEAILKSWVLPEEFSRGGGFQSEWFDTGDLSGGTKWVIEAMDEIGKRINKSK